MTVLLPLNVVITSERFVSPIKGPQSRSPQTLHPIPLLFILISLSTTPYLACFLSLLRYFHDAALRRSPHRPRPRLFDDRITSRCHPRSQQTKRGHRLLAAHHVTQPRSSLEDRLQTARHMGQFQHPGGG